MYLETTNQLIGLHGLDLLTPNFVWEHVHVFTSLLFEGHLQAEMIFF